MIKTADQLRNLSKEYKENTGIDYIISSIMVGLVHKAYNGYYEHATYVHTVENESDAKPIVEYFEKLGFNVSQNKQNITINWFRSQADERARLNG